MLVVRDLSVHYKQTVIGVAWAVIRPLLTMVVFTVIFGRIVGLPSHGTAPYAVILDAALNVPSLHHSSVVPEQWRLLFYSLNPMVGVIDGFR